MITLKVHTTRKTRNYVRYFIYSILLAVTVFSCKPIDNPETNDPRDKIIDVWNCRETSQTYGVTNYTIEISKSTTDSTKIFIDNFYQLGKGTSISAKMNGLSIIIPSQTVDGNLISGSGTIKSDYTTINLSYTSKVGTDTDNVTAVYSK
jgi:hypothetical protein